MKPSPATLRPMLPADGATLARIFRDSIEELSADDYDMAQREAWAAAADDEAAFAKARAGELTLVAVVGGEPVGFASLRGKDTIAMLYVAPRWARHGIGTQLVDALVRLATARGGTRLVADASDTARDLFAAAGFVAQRRNTVPLGDEWLGNTTMERAPAPANTP